MKVIKAEDIKANRQRIKAEQDTKLVHTILDAFDHTDPDLLELISQYEDMTGPFDG